MMASGSSEGTTGICWEDDSEVSKCRLGHARPAQWDISERDGLARDAGCSVRVPADGAMTPIAPGRLQEVVDSD
jgi:hypothetical protein